MDNNNYTNETQNDGMNNQFQQNNQYDQNNQYNQYNDNGSQPGKGAAIASLVLGIVSIVFWFFGMGALVGLVTGVIGLICSSSAKKAGFVGGIQTAGFVCSLIGLIGSALVFIACVACVGALGASGLMYY